MKRFLTALTLLCCLLLSSYADEKPPCLFHFKADLLQPDPNGALPKTIPASEYSSLPANIRGKAALGPDHSLQFDGKTTSITVPVPPDFNPGKDMTFIITVKNTRTADDNYTGKLLEAYFFRTGQFLFCRVNHCFYFNLHDGKKWAGGFNSGEVFEPSYGPEDYHQLALTTHYHEDRSQGEKWVEVHFYRDGEDVGSQRAIGYNFLPSDAPLECGTGSKLGVVWNTGGFIADAQVYERILSEDEILALAKANPYLKGNSQEAITAARLAELDTLPGLAPERKRVLASLATLEQNDETWQQLRDAPDSLIFLDGGGALLCLQQTPDQARIVSWYDKQAQRELLKPASPMFSLRIREDGKEKQLTPLTRGGKSTFSRQPIQQDGAWKFAINTTWERNGAVITADTDYTLHGARLEYHTSAKVTGAETTVIAHIAQPDCHIQPLPGDDRLLVPRMSGVEHHHVSTSGFTYEDSYPHGNCCMQLGAYYNDETGLFWTTPEPDGILKRLKYLTSKRRISISFGWEAPWQIPAQKGTREFAPAAPAVLEIFHGDWYDVGQLYIRELNAFRPPWWRPSLPNTDSPERFRNNCFWLLRNRRHADESTETLKSLQDFFEMNFGMVASSAEQEADCYSPRHRAGQEYLDFMKRIQDLGIILETYTDPRLWATKNSKGEDNDYENGAEKYMLVTEGKIKQETYSNTVCSIVCPYNDFIRDSIKQMYDSYAEQGMDGIYADQIGAALPLLCESDAHGHIPCETHAWYRDGWRRLFNEMRQDWRKRGVKTYLATEDNCETCAEFMDGMLTWRWMHDNHVPLFPLVFHGRTQFIGREQDCEEPRAAYAKAAVQLVNSEQIGWIDPGLVVSPLRFQYRVFLKQLMHLRKVLLPFFNEGEMLRPPQTEKPWNTKLLRWGVRGTGIVTTPDVVSSAWQFGNAVAIIFVNVTDSPQTNVLQNYPLPTGDYQVTAFNSNGTRLGADVKDNLKMALDIPAYGQLLLLAIPRQETSSPLLAEAEKRFQTIAKAPQTPDPFKLKLEDIPEQDIGPLTDLHKTLDAPYIKGCLKYDKGDCLYWIRYGIVYAGTAEFTENLPSTLEVFCTAPAGVGKGFIEFYTDDLAPEHKFAEFNFDGTFQTPSWFTFKSLQTTVTKQITGKHRIYIVLRGSSFCNFRSWQFK